MASIAFSSSSNIDQVSSWNCRHISTHTHRRRIRAITRVDPLAYRNLNLLSFIDRCATSTCSDVSVPSMSRPILWCFRQYLQVQDADDTLLCRLLDQQLWRCCDLHSRTAFSNILWFIRQHLIVQASYASVVGFGYISIGDTDLPISAWQFLQGSQDHSNAWWTTLTHNTIARYYLRAYWMPTDVNVLPVLQYGVENVSD